MSATAGLPDPFIGKVITLEDGPWAGKSVRIVGKGLFREARLPFPLARIPILAGRFPSGRYSCHSDDLWRRG